MQLSPIVAVHMTSALAAIATGPVALWARKGAMQRPKLHRAFGYAWVTLMLVTATSAIFIRSEITSRWSGFSAIHLLIPVTYTSICMAFWFLAKGNINGHRKTMQRLYFGACVVAGAFTLMPQRFLGQLVWHQWLGLI
jgi:uncharacterized membrane protein